MPLVQGIPGLPKMRRFWALPIGRVWSYAQQNISSIAFPSISTGVYGYPVEEASRIALNTVANYLEKHQDIKLIRFVLFDSRTYQTYVAALKELVLPE